jgi:hypothetical protein
MIQKVMLWFSLPIVFFIVLSIGSGSAEAQWTDQCKLCYADECSGSSGPGSLGMICRGLHRSIYCCNIPPYVEAVSGGCAGPWTMFCTRIEDGTYVNYESNCCACDEFCQE